MFGRRLLKRIEASERAAEERHRELIARGRASERVMLAEFTALHDEIYRSIARADERSRELTREFQESQRDLRDSIRANTEAVLAVLDRLGPAPG